MIKLEVFILTRPEDRCILGVYSKREFAEKHRQRTFCPDECEIEEHEIDGDLDEFDDDF